MDGDIRGLDFAGGWYAVIEHQGPYATIDQAYRGCADGIRRSSKYAFAMGPPIQFFREVGQAPEANLTEVCFPVRRKRVATRRRAAA